MIEFYVWNSIKCAIHQLNLSHNNELFLSYFVLTIHTIVYTLYAIRTLTWGAFRLVQCSHSLIILPQRSQSSSSELATPLVDEDTWLSWLWSWAAVVALLLPDVTDIWEVSEDLREWPFPPKELRDLASVSINLKYKWNLSYTLNYLWNVGHVHRGKIL